MDLDDLDRAAHYLKLSLKVYNDLRVEGKMGPGLALGEVAYRQGRLEEAIACYELALSMVYKRTVYGPGTWGWSPYGWFVFYRESIVPDMLPQLVRADITADLARRFRELDAWYEEANAQ
jgi:tetratricopeptide (TPR) repeat protein